jgi:hypothetical protein
MQSLTYRWPHMTDGVDCLRGTNIATLLGADFNYVSSPSLGTIGRTDSNNGTSINRITQETYAKVVHLGLKQTCLMYIQLRHLKFNDVQSRPSHKEYQGSWINFLSKTYAFMIQDTSVITDTGLRAVQQSRILSREKDFSHLHRIQSCFHCPIRL